MNKDNIIKLTLISFVTMLILTILGVTYAYFTLDIEGTPKDIVMSSGDLRLEYKDETELKLDGAFPGDTITKVITVTNIGTMNASYSLYLGNLINTIEKNELSISLDCKSYTNYNETTKAESGTCNGGKKVIPVSEAASSMTIKDGISIEPNITQEYTVTITFKETKKEQNYNKNKKFSGQIGIGESTLPEPVYCTFDGDLTQSVEYVNGQYTYRYKQENSFGGFWQNIDVDGWGVMLSDKSSSDPITGQICTYINNKPVVSAHHMFYQSKATAIDVSNFNTSNITNMGGMFYGSQATSINVSNLDTTNVTDMSEMFSYTTNLQNLDVSNFDTSKVTNMSEMFVYSQAKTLNVSNFDTSNVTNMSSMFSGTQVTTLDVSNFNTSKVTNMNSMFSGTRVTTLDVSGFDTSNVTNMSSMFETSQIKLIDLSNFNTSNVTDMSRMFYQSNITNLNLTNFNTSKVSNMSSMFYNSQATTIDLSSFDTSNVTYMSEMFSYCLATILDISSFDTSNVTSMTKMFYSCPNLDKIFVGNSFVTDAVTSSDSMFYLSTSLIGGAGTVYDSTMTDKTYARIDGGTTSPGYFTLKS